MRRLTQNAFLSVDGVMQAPGTPEEDRRDQFAHGGWQVPYFDDELMETMTGWFGAAGGLLLGRRTYEIFARYWPHHTDPSDPIAQSLNTLPKYVASRTLRSVDRHGSQLIEGDVTAAVRALKQQPGGELQVHGSGELAQTLMAHGLIDEYRLWTYPVVLGSGRRLFREGTTPAALQLVEARPTSRGAVLHIYRPAGKPTHGSVDG
jgi:dihydrofolate reductase